MTNAQYFMQLPADVRALFDNIASGTNHTAYEWFIAEIPPSSMHDAEQIRTLVNGGTVDVVHETFDPWGGSYVETDTIEIADRDFSRIKSGLNGGEYTPDNVVLENASVNRARGGDNMSDADLADAQSSLEFDSELMNMDGAIVNSSMSVGEMANAAEPLAETVNVISPVAETGSLLGDIGETVLDGLLPATMGFHVASHVADQFDDTTDKIGYGSLGAGLTVLACMTPPGQIVMAGYVGWNVCKLVGRGITAIDRHLQTN